MKKAIFSLMLVPASLLAFRSMAQVSVSVRVGSPFYCPQPHRPGVLVVTPPPPPPTRLVVIKPAPVVVAPAKRVVVVRPAPPPVYVVSRPRRAVVVTGNTAGGLVSRAAYVPQQPL